MNQDRCVGVIRQFVGAVKERWGKLTDNAALEYAGARDQRAGKMQESFGVSKDMAAQEFNEFLERNRDWDHSRQ
jgi:uncharacterized protein YjbJ (UPF0337 family)